MVGGAEIGVTQKLNGMASVHIQGTDCEKNDTRVIEVHDPKWEVSEGDSVWWQSHRAFFQSSTKEPFELEMTWNQ